MCSVLLDKSEFTCSIGRPKGLIRIVIVVLTIVTNLSQSWAFDPVSIESDKALIELSVIGTFRGGWFSSSTPTYPVYDRFSQHVFVGSDDRNRVEVIDFSDPNNPSLHSTIPGSLNRIAMSQEGILAVAGSGQVQFYNADGDSLSFPVAVPDAGDVEFTPDGNKLVVNQDDSISVVDLSGANFVNCRLGIAGCNLNPTVDTADFSVFNTMETELLAAGVRLPDFVPSITIAQSLDPASLTVTPDGQAAWISLIDSNALLKLDLATNQFTDIFGLGTKDNSLSDNGFPDTTGSLPPGLPGAGIRGNGFDASDQDGGINIQTWPMKTFYEPDGIGAYSTGGQTYIVTANEGDARSDSNGDFHVRLSTLTLDPNAFPNVFTLRQNSNLGRLRVSRVDGDTDGDGDLDEIFGFGARSFSIWSTDGNLVFDSGDDFEQITALALPENFNAAEDENEIDKRSDDRGPESEVLALGEINGRHYAFVGFERVSGIVVYDITDPTSPSFQQYINNRNFDVEPKTVCGTKGGVALATCDMAGDLETEGIEFISALQSPTGKPMLAVSHEASDSTTFYQIEIVPEPATCTTLLSATIALLIRHSRTRKNALEQSI